MSEQAGLIWYQTAGDYIKFVKQYKDQPTSVSEPWKDLGECPVPPAGEWRVGVFASIAPGETDRSVELARLRLLRG